jgi:hypothetical protein
VVRSNYRVELAAHCAHEDRVCGKWSIDSSCTRRRRQKRRVLLSEPSAIAPMRIQRAERDPWLRDPEPAAQPFTSNARRFRYRRRSQLLANVAQRNVRRRENDAQLVGREHHRDSRSGQMREHLRVPRIVVAASEECRLVDRRRDNAFDFSRHRHFHGALDREARQLSGQLRAGVRTPASHRLSDVSAGSLRTHDYNVTALADQLVSERFGYDLRSNPAGIPDGHGKTRFHTYILSDT